MNLSTVLTLNNEACNRMHMGDYRTAGDLLSRALRNIRESPSTDEPFDGKAATDEQELMLQPLCIHWNDQDESSFYLYNWAFEITGDIIHFSSLKQRRLSAIILYNTGLCCQAIGMTEGPEDTTFSKKALKMYDLALSLLNVNDLADRLIHLALLNNKGYIMNTFSESKAAQVCLEWLHYLLATSESFELLHLEHVVLINMNVVLLYGEHTHAAAA